MSEQTPSIDSSRPSPRDPEPRRLDDWLTATSLLAVLWLPLVAGIVEPGATRSELDNRMLAAFPKLEWTRQGLATLPRQLEAYYDDHLGLREHLIRAHAYVKVVWLGASPSEKVIVGKDGWFFFGHRTAVEQYRGLAHFSPTELEAWQSALETRRDWLAARDIHFVFVIAPNKHVVYPEFMPDSLPRTGGAANDPTLEIDEQHAQLAAHLMEHSDLTVVDLLPVMRDAKLDRRVYHRTDTHWNDLGAYAAYRQILAAVGRELPDFGEVSPPVEVDEVQQLTTGLGLTSIVGLSRTFPEQQVRLVKVDARGSVKPEHRERFEEREQKLLPLAYGVDDPALPRAVMFRDSFANALIPYLSENFRRIVFVWDRDINPRLIEIEKPDVVIFEIAGRFLDRSPPAFAGRTRER